MSSHIFKLYENFGDKLRKTAEERENNARTWPSSHTVGSSIVDQDRAIQDQAGPYWSHPKRVAERNDSREPSSNPPTNMPSEFFDPIGAGALDESAGYFKNDVTGEMFEARIAPMPEPRVTQEAATSAWQSRSALTSFWESKMPDPETQRPAEVLGPAPQTNFKNIPGHSWVAADDARSRILSRGAITTALIPDQVSQTVDGVYQNGKNISSDPKMNAYGRSFDSGVASHLSDKRLVERFGESSLNPSGMMGSAGGWIASGGAEGSGFWVGRDAFAADLTTRGGASVTHRQQRSAHPDVLGHNVSNLIGQSAVAQAEHVGASATVLHNQDAFDAAVTAGSDVRVSQSGLDGFDPVERSSSLSNAAHRSTVAAGRAPSFNDDHRVENYQMFGAASNVDRSRAPVLGTAYTEAGSEFNTLYGAAQNTSARRHTLAPFNPSLTHEQSYDRHMSGSASNSNAHRHTLNPTFIHDQGPYDDAAWKSGSVQRQGALAPTIGSLGAHSGVEMPSGGRESAHGRTRPIDGYLHPHAGSVEPRAYFDAPGTSGLFAGINEGKPGILREPRDNVTGKLGAGPDATNIEYVHRDQTVQKNVRPRDAMAQNLATDRSMMDTNLSNSTDPMWSSEKRDAVTAYSSTLTSRTSNAGNTRSMASGVGFENLDVYVRPPATSMSMKQTTYTPTWLNESQGGLTGFLGGSGARVDTINPYDYSDDDAGYRTDDTGYVSN